MPPTPTADISGFTDEQKRLFSQAASLGSGITATDNGQTYQLGGIKPSEVSTSTSPLTLSPYSPVPTPDTSDLDKLISLFDQPTAGQTQAQEAQKSTLQTIQDTMARLMGEQSKKAELETSAGLPDLNKTLAELTNQIRQNNAGAFGASQAQEDRLAPTFTIQGTQAQIERQRAVKNYGLAAAAEAVQGNIALAQDNIQRALDAEFRPLEKVLEYQKLFLEQNRADLEREDKKAYETRSIVLAERERVLNQQKEDKNNIYSLVTAAAQNSANPPPSSVINSALASGDINRAFSLLAPYLSDPNAAKKALYEMENKRLANQKLQKEIDEIAIKNGVGTVDVKNITPTGNALLESVKNLRFSSNDEAKRIIGNVTSALNRGDEQGAVDTLKQFGYQKMSVGQQADYDLYDSAKSAFESAYTQIEDQNLVAGPYKALLNKAAPWVSIKRDKEYNELRSLVELGQAQLRKGFYGTAVTGAESANARNFLIVDSDDIDTIQWKLKNGSQFLEFSNDATIARQVGLPKPDINDYLTYRVKEKSSGQTGEVPRSEYDPSLYEIISSSNSTKNIYQALGIPQ